MPPMMGMGMVMSPVLIPQQNGPPLIINVPSYVYPNIPQSQPLQLVNKAAAPMTVVSSHIRDLEHQSSDVSQEPPEEQDVKPLVSSGRVTALGFL